MRDVWMRLRFHRDCLKPQIADWIVDLAFVGNIGEVFARCWRE